MHRIPTVRTFAPHEWRKYRELRLLALADSPDSFGSTLAPEQGQTDDEWSARLARGTASSTDLPLVAEVSGDPVGLAWGKIGAAPEPVAHLYQMWVAPDFRGIGIGRMLLHAAIDWAKASHARTMVLRVTCGDTPASRLYMRAGFRCVGAAEPLRPDSPLLTHTMRLELNESAA